MLKIDSAYIEIINKCNLDCLFCYNSSGQTQSRTEMSVREIGVAINNLTTLGAKSITFSGGEPFLHRDWQGIYNLIKENSSLNFSAVTNGTINNLYLLRLNKENDNFHVQVSVDGHNEKVNSMIRGKGNFLKAIDMVRQLAKGKNKPSVRLVLSKLNEHGIADFIELVISIGGSPGFAFVNNIGNAQNTWRDVSLDPIEKVRIIKRINALSEKFGINITMPICANGCPLYDESNPVNVLIKPDGSLHPCQQLYDNKFRFGNIINMDLNEINTKIKVIQGLAKKRLSVVYNCNTCINRSMCKKGCMADAYYNNSDCLAADGNCEMRIRQTLELGLTELFEKKDD